MLAVTQTVKDVVQSLVDDRLVEVEKVGSGNFFWAFPAKAFVAVRACALSVPQVKVLRPILSAGWWLFVVSLGYQPYLFVRVAVAVPP